MATLIKNRNTSTMTAATFESLQLEASRNHLNSSMSKLNGHHLHVQHQLTPHPFNQSNNIIVTISNTYTDATIEPPLQLPTKPRTIFLSIPPPFHLKVDVNYGWSLGSSSTVASNKMGSATDTPIPSTGFISSP